ncbi:MAG: IS630 family transposase [Deltaproteobacteria bacterium]|nr:IS630 family transposase [Deltaproteobacteria bacterium]
MLRIDPKWGETATSLLRKSLDESGRVIRTRLMSLHLIASGLPATKVAKKLEKNRATIASWVQQFNQEGLAGLAPRWRGRQTRLLSDPQLEALGQAVKQHPRVLGIKNGRWTAKMVVSFVKKTFRVRLHQDTARKYLHKLGLSYKVPTKKFLKADPEKQEEFAADLEELEATRCHRAVTVYVDEGKIEQDALPRKGWFLKGVPAEVESISPGKKKILFYAAVVRPLGKVFSMQVDRFTQHQSIHFLLKIKEKLPGYRIDLVWDNASWHNTKKVQAAIVKMKIHEHRLPPYSPKMNACEYFIRWSKEVLSYNYCWNDLKQLKHSFRGFVASLARRASEVLQRCRPQMLGFKIG